jgi:PAS domain S-box-containing protein
MSWFEENKPIAVAIIQAVTVFVVLFVGLVVFISIYDFTFINMNALAFLLAITVIVFISKAIYEVSASSERIKREAETLANRLVSSSEQLFLEVYNNSPVAYLVVGEFGEIISVNPSTARLFGRSGNSLLKQDFFSLIGNPQDEHQAILKQKFQKGIVIADEDVKITRQSGIAWTKLSIFQFSSTDGKKLSLVTLVDYTKQKEIDTAKSEFVSLASHQLRTPISGMRWSAELLLMDGVDTLSPQQKRYIDRLLSSIQRMSSLVDDFLQVSRFELGTRVLKLETIKLKELCDDIITEQQVNINAKRLTVNKKYDEQVSLIESDLGLLRMIITNLFTNAVKYSRPGGEVTLSYEAQGSELQIIVKDTGMGIPVVEQGRIFSKIFRASNAIKEVPDGTGLGLYIVKKAVEQLEGRISFVSAEDVGTTFTVVVPLD